MAKRKSGLGNKGVEVLFSSSKAEKVKANEASNEIEVSKIVVSPYQPRTNFDEEKLKSLVESIKEEGIIQPILLRKIKEDEYELIAGERRLRAAKIMGHKTIPAIVKLVGDESAAIYALLENVQRENLNPIEEAAGLEKLIKEFKFTQESLSKTTGKSRSHISNLIRLLSLDAYVIKLLSEQKIDMGHARALLPLSKNSQKIFADKIVNHKLSVREVENLVNSKKTPASRKSSKKAKDSQLLHIEKQLSERYGVYAQIDYSSSKRNGKIIFKYSNLEVLEGLLKKLGYKK